MGTFERWQDRETGTFYCPGCGSERVYRHRRSRNWFHVIVPLIPRDITADVYVCQGCHRVYDEHVIASPPTSDLATRLQRITRAAAVLAVLDGDPYEEASRRVAVTVIQGAGLPHYSTTDLDADLRSIDVENVEAEARELVIDLEPAGRERLVVDIGHVATATGTLTPSNRAMLDRLARALEMTPGVVHRILARLEQDAANIAAFAERNPAPAPPDPAGGAGAGHPGPGGAVGAWDRPGRPPTGPGFS